MRRYLSIGLVALTVGGLVMAGVVDFEEFFYPYGLLVAAYLAVGWLVTWRAGSNPIGWLLLCLAASAGVGLGVRSLVEVAVTTVGAGWADAVGNALATAGILLAPAALLRFPDGRLLTPRWRWVEFAIGVTALLGATAALLNGGWGGDVDQALALSPLRAANSPLGDLLSGLFYPLMGTVMVLSGLSIILRYRRSVGDERLQMKWLTYAGALLLMTFLVMAIVSGNASADEGWEELLVVVALISVPLTMGIAVLRYRLYDIDLVISRTVVLALLAGFITAVYAVIVVLIGELIGGEANGLLLPIAATAVVAVAFEPVRHTCQRWANRLVYGRRATPYEVLSDLTERLSQGESGEGLLSRMAARLGDGTGAERATIWLAGDESMTVGSSWPAVPVEGRPVDLNDPHVFPVTHDGVVVGAFEVVKPRGAVLSSTERVLITDLAGSAGAVLGFQRLNDSLAEKATELAASRARLVDAQHRERRRLERDLHDGAQQLIVALKVKIGLIRVVAARHDATDVVDLLDRLTDESQRALDEVRALAKGLYPPVLESDGLGSAISALASGTPEEVVVTSNEVGRYDRDIEAAVYFDISEAVTNAVKHANGPIRVHIAESDGHLRFSVTDNGPGFDLASANGGSGLHNLRDRIDAVGGRLEIVSTTRGTTVSGDIPLEPVTV
jgi:signal transduction histidine kinase